MTPSSEKRALRVSTASSAASMTPNRDKRALRASTASSAASIDDTDDIAQLENPVMPEFEIHLHFEDLVHRGEASTAVTPMRVRVSSVAAAKERFDGCQQAEWWRPDSDHFQTVYSLALQYRELGEDDRRELVDLVCAGARTATEMAEGAIVYDGPASLRNAFKVTAFFAAHLLRIGEDVYNAEIAEDEKTTRGAPAACREWTTEHRTKLLLHLLSLLDADAVRKVWRGEPPGEDFLSLCTQCALHLLERPAVAKDQRIRKDLLTVLQTSCASFGFRSGVITPLLHLTMRYEHMPAVLAQLIATMRGDEQNAGHFEEDLVREVAALNPTDVAKDAAAGKNIEALLADLGRQAPNVVKRYENDLLRHFYGESYPMRNGLVEMLAQLVESCRTLAATGLVSCATKEQSVNRLLGDLTLAPLDEAHTWVQAIVGRCRDVNAFARSRTLQVLASLTEKQLLRRSEILNVADVALVHARDRAAVVRKSSLQLLARLLEYNPFGPVLSASAIVAMNQAKCGAENEDVDHLDLIGFTQRLNEACDIAHELLRSSLTTDVHHAVGFLVRSVHFQLENAGHSTRWLLPLLLSRDGSVRDSAMCAFEALIVQADSADERLRAFSTVQRLLELAQGATLGEMHCMAELIANGKIVGANELQVLLDLFFLRVPNTDARRRHAAAEMLVLAARRRAGAMRLRASPLLELLQAEATQCTTLRYVCMLLPYAAPDDADTHAKVGAAIEALLCAELPQLRDGAWLPMAEQAITALYQCCAQPAGACTRLLSQVWRRALQRRTNTDVLRAAFVSGHVAVQQLLYIESSVVNIRKTNATWNERTDKTRRESAASKEKDDGLCDQLGVGHAQTDAQLDRAAELGEREIFSERSPLRLVVPLIAQLCTSASASALVRTAATTALCKIMMVSEGMCERHLQVLFTLLRRSPDVIVRSNAVIAVGDLLFRFPNLVEPWSVQMYGALSDAHVRVRKHALLTVAHLVLNDMLKIRGNLDAVLVMTQDEKPHISEIARMFFAELSRKSGHRVYNVLPEMLSNLWRREALSDATMRSATAFAVSFVRDKERLAEGSVEKLCHRFRTVHSTREARLLAHCLTLFNHTERTFRRLHVMHRCYVDALADEEVHSSFVAIVAKLKKFAAPELRAQLDEYTDRVLLVATTRTNAAADNESQQGGGDVKVSRITRKLSHLALNDVGSSLDTEGTSRQHDKKPANSKQSRRDRPVLGEQNLADDGCTHTTAQQKTLDDVRLTPRAVVRETKRRGSALRSAGRSRRRRFILESGSEDEEVDEAADNTETER